MTVGSYQRLELGSRALLTAWVLLACNKGSAEADPRAVAAPPSPSTAAQPASSAAVSSAAVSSAAAPSAAAPVPPSAEAEPAPPVLAVRSVILDPSFVGKEGSFAAGTAFPLREPRASAGVVVLSCHHIFGPMGGLSADVQASALPAFIQSASVSDRDGKSYALGPVLPVPHARTFTVTTRDASADVSVFQAPAELAPHALELAPSLPAKDERVWLLARVQGQTELMWPAVVFYVTDKFLVYQFDSSTIDLRATSGAPVVNAKGQVVAINLGGNPVQGVVRGFGTPAPGVRRALDAALPAK